MNTIIYQSPTIELKGISIPLAKKLTEIKLGKSYSTIHLKQSLGRVWRNTSLGYIARIIDGKLVRVARVTCDSIDYNFETH